MGRPVGADRGPTHRRRTPARAGRRYGTGTLADHIAHLQAYAERAVRALIGRLPSGRFVARDVMDDDGFGTQDIPIQVALERDASSPEAAGLIVDFTGTGPQAGGGINAVASVTLSATFYVIRCLLGDDQIPTNAGIFRPVRVILPEGSLVNARFPAAVAAGNVETSQRITDVLLAAFAGALPDLVPAASQGTMNNLTIGGTDPRREGSPFAYYETIGGGMGAAPGADGLSAVHVHMTNTLNTPVEALEYAYPLRVTRYQVRRGSGGAGTYRGGDGIYREIELLADATVTILSERRRHAPAGLAGGEAGAPGENRLYRAGPGCGAASADFERLPSKVTFDARCGDRIGIATPGGGGHGR